MRKILLTLLAAGAMLAAIPAASIAMGGEQHQGDRHREREHRREHRAGHHHHHQQFRIRHERFGPSAGDHARGTAGTVAEFAQGRLTIRLADGASISGAVNRFTEVECELRGDRNDRGDDRGDDGPRHDAGDDRGHDDSGHHDGDRRHRCAMIVLGSTVRDATLTLGRSGAVWTRVDLIDS